MWHGLYQENKHHLLQLETADFVFLKVSDVFRRGFLSSSAGKESTYNAGDLSSIPGSGRFSGEGIGYPLQYSWASLVAQLVKKKSACNAGDLGSIPGLGHLEKGTTTHSSILAWRIPWTI